jgi:tetratricopeptide (TPR) repeat protein
MRPRAAFVALALALGAPGARAQAGAGGVTAADLKREGDEAMDRRHYADAIAIYLRALERQPEPSVYYNVARAYEATGEYPEALRWLRRFAAEAPGALRERVPKLDELLTELRGRVTEVSVRVNVPGARVLVRDRLVGTSPVAAPLELTSGDDAAVEVIAAGYATYRRAVALPPGGSIALDVRLLPEVPRAAAPAGPRAEAPSSGRGLAGRWWFWAGAGAAVVAAGVLTYVALTTERAADAGDFGSPRGPVTTALARF